MLSLWSFQKTVLGFDDDEETKDRLHPKLTFVVPQPILFPLSSSTTREITWLREIRAGEWCYSRGTRR